jgi:surface antigen
VFALLALASAGPARAGSFGVPPSQRQVRPGGTVGVTISLDGVATCSAAAPLPSLAIRFNATGLDRITLQIAAPRTLPDGSYPVRVSCDGLPWQQVTVRLGGAARTVRSAARMRLHVTGAHSPYLRSGRAFDLARASWLQKGLRSLKYYRDGQCTDWAVQRRPDVVERVYEARNVAKRLGITLRGLPASGHLGYARTWATAAAAAGMTVHTTPVVGALVVWQPGVEGATARTGHIGYVESLSADGAWFATSEMHIHGVPYRMAYRTLSSRPVKGRSFIWPS